MQIDQEELGGAIRRLSAAIRRPAEREGGQPGEDQLSRDLALVVNAAQLARPQADPPAPEPLSAARIEDLLGKCSTVVVLERPGETRIFEYQPGLSDLAKETMDQIMISAHHGRVYLAAIVADMTSRASRRGRGAW